MDDKLITTLKEYRESYKILLENHLNEYVDYDELHFIKKQLELYNSYYDSTNIKRYDIVKGSNPKQPFKDFEYRLEKENTETSNTQLIKLILDFDKYPIKYDNLEIADYLNLDVCEKLAFSFSKIIEFLIELQNKLTNPIITPENSPEQISKLIWLGDEIELTELVKALIQAKKISIKTTTQKETFIRFRAFFNYPKLKEVERLSVIKRRTKDYTSFLNELENSLLTWIKAKD